MLFDQLKCILRVCFLDDDLDCHDARKASLVLAADGGFDAVIDQHVLDQFGLNRIRDRVDRG